MPRSVLEVFKIESQSNPGKWYVVSEFDNGEWACGCIGWTRHMPRRDCQHIRWAKAGQLVAEDSLLRAVEVSRRRHELKLKRLEERHASV